MKLPPEKFKEIVKNTPLVSIDLLVVQNGKYLVGPRNNPPAKGYLFVPGGRIFKDELLSVAFERIFAEELGISKTLKEACFVAVSEHYYPDSMYDPEISTHYIVLSYTINLRADEQVRPDSQHGSLTWLTEDEIRIHPKVHGNTVRHFPIKSGSPPLLEYYATVIDQLKFYNNVVWAFPPAYLAVLFFAIDKAKGMIQVLWVLGFFSLSLLYVFTRHVSNQKSLIKLAQSLEQKIGNRYGSDYIPEFHSPPWYFKATTVVQVTLYLGTFFLFYWLLFRNIIEPVA